MNKYEVIIGIEIHVQMKTKSKMFSSTPNSFGEEPNSMVGLFDFAFPGVLPLVNKQAVVNAIRVANTLHMEIDDTLIFERKNYFYSDLPKGYQLTEQFRPLGRNGYILINDKKIAIERLHLEEDTCKQIHLSDYSLLDFNRAGVPLVEIVSKPDISNIDDAIKYVEEIRSIVSFLDVSDGKMEQGSLRCDINVSLKNKEKIGKKVEIKNLNSLTNIKEAIKYEIVRQSKLLDEGKEVKQETRRFDEHSKETVLMRYKEDEIDYKFFTDPNILPIKLSKEFIDETISASPELAESKKKRYIALGLSEYDASLLTLSKDTCEYFEEMINHNIKIKNAANWINGEIQSYLNKERISIKEFKISPLRMAKLISLVETNKISIKQAKDIFATMLNSDFDPEEIATTKGISQNSNEGMLRLIVVEVIKDNSKAICDYKKGNKKALGYLVGQVMKNSGGEANPSLANKIIIEEIDRR